MGCDGGSIPTRSELVKTKKKPEQVDKDTMTAIRWNHCTISKELLTEPIVTCELGFLYNKEEIIKRLLDKTVDPAFSHIKSLKDIIKLNFTANPAYEDDHTHSRFICPVTQIEFNGHYRFVAIRTCGCVLSEKALKEVPTAVCLKCGKEFTQTDIILLNGSKEEIDNLRQKMLEKREREHLERKEKKSKKNSSSTTTTTTTTTSTVMDNKSDNAITNGTITTTTTSSATPLSPGASNDNKKRKREDDVEKVEHEHVNKKVAKEKDTSLPDGADASIYQSLFKKREGNNANLLFFNVTKVK